MAENKNVTGELIDDKIKDSRNIILFIIAFSTIMIIAGTFYIGAAYSCRNSEGELIGGFNLIKLKCNNIETIGVCKYKDQLLIPPKEVTGTAGIPLINTGWD